MLTSGPFRRITDPLTENSQRFPLTVDEGKSTHGLFGAGKEGSLREDSASL